ncbi:MAG: TIGR03435 family protein [Terriglobia bacterium]|jgi:uncharacterized protein (TIGR03435 family)
MKQDMAAKLRVGKARALAAVGAAAVGASLVFGLFHAQRLRAQAAPSAGAPLPSFEVASIKPNRSGDNRIGIRFQPGRFNANGVTVKQLIGLAYNVRDFQVTGGPSWISSDRFDIDAKEPDAFAEQLAKLPPDQRRGKLGLLIQSLLADRFALKVSHASKELPIYALVVAKGGPKVPEAKPGDTYPNGIKRPDGRPVGGAGMMTMGPGQLTGQGVPITFLVQQLSQQLGRTVLDQTGLKGTYDLTLKWTPDQSSGGMFQGPPGGGPAPDNAPPPDASGPSIFTAVQEQLGLKLESTKGPVEILVIGQVEKPSEN